jgi:hypothetical protein
MFFILKRCRCSQENKPSTHFVVSVEEETKERYVPSLSGAPFQQAATHHEDYITRLLLLDIKLAHVLW